MFTLKKITLAGRNVPEPVRLTLKSHTTIPHSRPVLYKDGELHPLTITAQTLPTHITLKTVNGKEALCYEVTPNMVFETKTLAPPTTMVVGVEYSLSADGDGIAISPVGETTRGAVLIDKKEAKAAGDRVLVSFR